MKNKLVTVFSTMLITTSAGLAYVQTVQAAGFNPMNMMNPSKWFGGKNRRYDDHYYDGYGPGAYDGYGPGPYGGYGAPPGYGYGYGATPPGYAPGYGYGYGAPPATGYGYAAPSYPSRSGSTAKPSGEDNIKALENRIKRLEAAQPRAPAASTASPYDSRTSNYPVPDYSKGSYGSGYQPTYRPLDQ